MIVYQNTTWQRTLTVRNAAGALYPLDDATLDVVISRRTTNVALITLTEGDGITTADQGASPGVAAIVLTPEKIATLDPGSYVIVVGATIDGARQVIVAPQRLSVR